MNYLQLKKIKFMKRASMIISCRYDTASVLAFSRTPRLLIKHIPNSAVHSEADVMLAMARIDEKVGLSKSRKEHPPMKMKLPSRVERKCGEWCEVQSKTKKKIYYLNIRTKETTWKKPPGWCDKTVSRIPNDKYTFNSRPTELVG